jgi:hypothetical protein
MQSDGPHVVYVDSNQHVNQLWYDAGGWHGADLTASVFGPNASLATGFTSWIELDGPHVVYVAANQHVHQLWYDSSGWHSQDLTSMVNGPLAAVPGAGTPIQPTLNLTNVTHPNLTPNFAVGDTFQITIHGAPNQPVNLTQTANGSTGTSYMGNTDVYGNYTITGMEQTGDIGTYTQVWTVGGVQAASAISFVVGELGTGGTVTTTEIGVTADGHLEGISSLSITNGVVSTYSATALDYTASLYYDSNTVATLFDEGSAISQAVTPITTSTAAALSANATAWHDYDLQTDHYAVAYFVSGAYFANPLYWGNSCYVETGDCSINGGGIYAYWVTAAAIYVGSTVADQTNVPSDASLPAFDLSAYDGFLASSQPPQDMPTFSVQVTEWLKRISLIYPIAKLVDEANNPNHLITAPPIPMFVDLSEEHYDVNTAERQRTFVLKDIYGRPWNMAYPVAVRERFTNITTGGGGTAPEPNGIWFTRIPRPSAQAEEIVESRLTDHHRGNPAVLSAQVNYLQYYYATDFALPSYFDGLSDVFSIPGLSSGIAVPLYIKDSKNKCSPLLYLPAEGISFNWKYIYINGDGGPGTGCRVQ